MMHPTNSVGDNVLKLMIFALVVAAGLVFLPRSDQAVAQSSKTKSTASDKLTKLEDQAQKCRTAAEAVSLYEIFLADDAVKNPDRKAAEEKLAAWKVLADENSVRVGKKWMPKDKEEELRKQADDLVKQAIVMLENGNLNQADTFLSQASKLYPEHLDSLFLLALGAMQNKNFANAEKQFTEMSRRAPNNLAILNNLAVAEALSGKGDISFIHLKQAAAIDPDYGPTVQNLGALVYMIENGARSGRPVSASSATKEKSATEFAKLRTTSKAKYDPSQLYVFVTRIREGRANTVSKQDEEAAEQIVGNGTGFVVAPNYVLTNRHVVEDADSLVIVEPTEGKQKKLFKATVVAVSKEFDLAIVKCDGLTAPPLPLRTAPITRGTEVLALGFPVSSIVGSGIKATRGIVTGLPSGETEGMMVSDVQINPGNSGGPLCDSAGRVLGVNTAVTATTRFVKGYGLSIPITEAIPFLNSKIPGFKATEAPDAKKEWTEVDAAVAPSTVMILIRKKPEGSAAKPTK